MKRTRNILKSCDCCQIQFESTTSFTRHCGTQAHKHQLLAARNASVIEDWENDCAPGPLPGYPVPLQNQPIPQNSIEVRQEEDFYNETTNEIFQNTIAEQSPSEDLEFFPFPDEKFFLLYCYAHGISRPKVHKICHKTILTFLGKKNE